MSKRKIKPTFIHQLIDGEETCIGEFHHGSASDKKILPSGKGIKLFLTAPPYNLGFDYGEVTDSQPEEDYHQRMEQRIEDLMTKVDAGEIKLEDLTAEDRQVIMDIRNQNEI